MLTLNQARMEPAVCSVPPFPTQFGNPTTDELMRNCGMSSMFDRPRNKRKSFQPNAFQNNGDSAPVPDESYDSCNDDVDGDYGAPLDLASPASMDTSEPTKDSCSTPGLPDTPSNDPWNPENLQNLQNLQNGGPQSWFPQMSQGGLQMPPNLPPHVSQALAFMSQMSQHQTSSIPNLVLPGQQHQGGGNSLKPAHQQLSVQTSHQQPNMDSNDHSPDQNILSNIKQEPKTPQSKGHHQPQLTPQGSPVPLTPTSLSMNNLDRSITASEDSSGSIPSPTGPSHPNGQNEPIDFSRHIKTEPGMNMPRNMNINMNMNMRMNMPMDMVDLNNSNASLNEEGGTLTCDHCHRTFKSQINLDRHVDKAHNPKNTKIFTCLLCPYTTRFYSNMYVHIRTHTGDKPYWCGACGASFSQGSSLKIHIISKHGGNKKYFILDRKLGKANLLRFWQRREASHVREDMDIKPDLSQLNGLNFPNGIPLPPELMNKKQGQENEGGHNPFMPKQNPFFPNGMNMLNPMMNPLGLNIFGQNPMTPNIMGMNNMNPLQNGMFFQPGLLNGLNLKNSAFFTKTTPTDQKVDPKSPCPPVSANQQPQPQNQEPQKPVMTNPLAGFPTLPNGLPIFSNCGPMASNCAPVISNTAPIMANGFPAQQNGAGQPGSPIVNPTQVQPPRVGSNPGQEPAEAVKQASNVSPPVSMADNESKIEAPVQDKKAVEPVHENKENNEKPATPKPKKDENAQKGPQTVDSDLKLRSLRRSVVKMLRLMVPDLPMDKDMDPEGEGVDVLLKDVIWSTPSDDIEEHFRVG